MKNFIYGIGLITIGIFVISILNSFSYITPKVTDVERSKITELSKRIKVSSFIDEDNLVDGTLDDEADIIYPDTASNETYFKVKEFTKFDLNATEETIRKIKEIHIPQLIKVRDKIGEPIVIRSAARSYKHEIKRGRSGKSNHIYSRGKGAVDLSLLVYTKKKLDKLENAIIDTTNYNRISRYKTFIHVDYGTNRFGGRAYYRNTKYGWIYIGKVR